ncbi:MAG: polysaccharide biosynthesis tyrosine autokinase, partial [Verrucomicrobia bacterium]|nr:polysaccharide biosynthesis tyrosine autokinase [Verrucomicrobiota bacterium]
KLHFLDYWRIIRIRKLVILTVFLLVVLTTTLVTYSLKPTFMSSVRMEVQKDTTDVQTFSGNPNAGNYDPYFIQTQFERIQSKDVLYEVIRELGLSHKWAVRDKLDRDYDAPDTFILLNRVIDPRQIRNTSIIEVRVYDKDRQEAADIANKIADIYRKNRLEQRKRMAQAGLESLGKQYADQTNLVNGAKLVVDQLRKELDITIVSVESSQTAMTIEQESLRQQEALLNEHRAVYQKMETTVLGLRPLYQTNREALLGAMPRALVTPDENLITLISRHHEAQQQLVVKEKELGQENTEVLKTRALVAETKKELDNLISGIMAGMELALAASKDEVDKLAANVEDATRRCQKAAENIGKFSRALREQDTQEQLRDALFKKLKLETVDASMTRSFIVDITDPAEAAAKPKWPNVPLNIALGILLGLIGGIGLAFFIEYLDTSVKTIDDVERALQSPVLGVIPQNVGSLLDEGVESPHAEAYRVLRTNVLFTRKDPKHNCLTVVSGGQGEGKSTTVFNLATVFAQSGQRVLLVDSDLRRPSLHKRLKVSNSVGLTNYLLKQQPLEEVIQHTPLPGLDFLPSGRLPSSSLGILNSAQMRDFIREVKARYDFVLFDSPPIMGVSDAQILVSEIDLSVLVIQYRKYPQAMNVRAKQMVDSARGNLVGVVLNNINISQDAYYYYYSGYDYHTRKHDDEDNGEPKGDGRKPAGDHAQAGLKSKY